MDSGTSGSMQSSSGGGDDDFDSRTESISNFFHSSSSGRGTTSFPPPQPQQPSPPTSSLFDTLSYLDAFARSPPSTSTPLTFDPPWSSRPLRQPPPPTLIPPPTSSSANTPPGMITGTPQFSPQPLAPDPPPPPPPQPPRASKKRSRASRRAPTTVLTTDTSNFRAMVQEFTGIPAAPFAASGSSSSPFARTRLDLFHSGSAAMPPYVLRPFAQKIQAPTFGSPPTTNNTTTTTTTNIGGGGGATSSTMTTPTTISNYQLPPELGLNMQHSSSPMLNLQSLLSAKYNLPTNSMPAFATTKSQQHQPEYGVHDLVGSEGMHAGWLPEGVAAPDGANYGSLQRGNSCKINYSAAAAAVAGTSSEFHPEKGPESVPARGEGMMDSWICSSD